MDSWSTARIANALFQRPAKIRGRTHDKILEIRDNRDDGRHRRRRRHIRARLRRVDHRCDYLTG